MHNPMELFGQLVVAVATLYLVVGIARFNNTTSYRGLERNKRRGESWPL